MNLKKLGILSLALILSLGMTACGKKADNTSEEISSSQSVESPVAVSEESSTSVESSVVSQETSVAESLAVANSNDLESYMKENPDVKKIFDDEISTASNSELDASVVIEGNSFIMKFTLKEKWSDDMIKTGQGMLKSSFESESFVQQANEISNSFAELGFKDVKVKIRVVQPDDTEILTVDCN